MRTNIIRKAYLACSWGIVALGVLHMAATARLFTALTQSALWFLSGGLAMVLTGAINLLNRAYGGSAPGLQWVCRAANVALAVFAVTAGLVGRAGAVETIVVVGLMAGTAVLSLLPHAAIAESASGAA